MRADLEFLIGLLDRDEEPSCVAQEDLDGKYATTLQTWRKMGFLSSEPGMNPVVSCPHCDEGVPYRLGERFLCNFCRSTVDRRHLFLWKLNREAFLVWLAAELKLQDAVRRIDERLWQLAEHELLNELAAMVRRRVTSFLISATRALPPADLREHALTHVALIEALASGERSRAEVETERHIALAAERIRRTLPPEDPT